MQESILHTLFFRSMLDTHTVSSKYSIVYALLKKYVFEMLSGKMKSLSQWLTASYVQASTSDFDHYDKHKRKCSLTGKLISE